MSQAAPNLPDDVQRRIDDHLDAIERALNAALVSRKERRSIVDEVETQIHDMLAAGAGEPAATLTEILAKLDPPQAYAPESSGAAASSSMSASARSWPSPREAFRRARQWWSVQRQRSRVSPPAIVGALWSGIVVLLLLSLLGFRRPPAPLVALTCLFGLTAPVAVTCLGFFAVRRIRRAENNEYGLPLALIETFFCPVLLANLALIGVLAASEEAGLVLLAALVIITANIGLARYAWRRFGHRFLSRVDAL